MAEDMVREEKMEEEEHEPLILMFATERCAYPCADVAGLSKISYPPNVRLIRVRCCLMISPDLVLEAFRKGVDGIIIGTCYPPDCAFKEGVERTRERMKKLAPKLREMGIEIDRLRVEAICSVCTNVFKQVTEEMTEILKLLGPTPYAEERMRLRKEKEAG
ncbi:methyl-viologen-reducing hydrogenase delta subunit [Ammonifex degensii KC4]|uniref:Methyl-viologen-reducing hydrogenase delta subunit n=1 Tax=Ammonifex degensii (strain DSM 10501 / KC4) TaxID=429009 RepID=C9RCR7_AMMDK|nr:hydrogenase iron-sulfur subunit [Ammonifex degensii]ACX52044.1 methyl-viologen-reducing hydrogenase delta subunit [Ammonifex degensii KC4]